MQLLATPERYTPEPMPADVVTALREIHANAADELDVPMFRLDGDYIAYEGRDTARIALVAVPGDGLYARYDRRVYLRARTAAPARAFWAPVAECPITDTDAVAIAAAMWRLTTPSAT